MQSVDTQETKVAAGRISVVMPCFNAAAFLEEAIASVMGQTHRDLELIVIDDGSTDGSVEIARRLARESTRPIRVLEQDHAGPYPARNLGAALSTGEFLAFLDADDYWSEDCLERLHRALAGSQAVLAYCGWQKVGKASRASAPYVPPDYESGDKLSGFLKGGSPWPIHAALLRRSVFEEVGGFSARMPIVMDYDLWLRVGVTRPIVRVPEVLAYYRFHDHGQISARQWPQARNSWMVKRWFLQTHPELARRLPRAERRRMLEGTLLRRGYMAYWNRDLSSAHRIFRLCLRVGGWRLADLRYLLPALLPLSLFEAALLASDRVRGQKAVGSA